MDGGLGQGSGSGGPSRGVRLSGYLKTPENVL